jgi:SAM-dependent methyltransferase
MPAVAIVSIFIGVAIILSRGPFILAPRATRNLYLKLMANDGRVRLILPYPALPGSASNGLDAARTFVRLTGGARPGRTAGRAVPNEVDMQAMPKGAGKSSFDLVDPDRLSRELGPLAAATALDVGCGAGNYALFLSERVGESGVVHAVDAWAEGIGQLKERAAGRGAANIHAIVWEASAPIPVPDASVDLVLMATVLHDFVEQHVEQAVLQQIARVLKPRGRLAVIEFKKIEGPPGPPLAIRLSEPETAGLVQAHGLRDGRSVDIGDYHYLSVFAGPPPGG